MEVTLGGERLGSGNKQKVYMHNYERSTHDLSFIWRSTMASGTLVPFLSTPALSGDTFDINLNCDVLTHPTIGPLFGTYKIQLDTFLIPIRLYQAELHMNMLDIGRNMAKVLLPQLKMAASAPTPTKNIDNQQINPSCIFSYLGMRGLGVNGADPSADVQRNFNAIAYLSYWSIYKQYYANKQEEIGVVIHKRLDPDPTTFTSAVVYEAENSPINIDVVGPQPGVLVSITPTDGTYMVVDCVGLTEDFDPTQLKIWVKDKFSGWDGYTNVLGPNAMFNDYAIYVDTQTIVCSRPNFNHMYVKEYGYMYYSGEVSPDDYDQEPTLLTFDLNQIDVMRKQILQWNAPTQPFPVDGTSVRPYDLPFRSFTQPSGKVTWTKQFAQEGLAIKTYNSDLFNNWIQTEWIDGPTGVGAVTAVDTSAGNFTIDALNIANKLYNMLNRIAVSGGTYDDWLDATYTHQRTRAAEEPMYMGGLIKNLVFQEVVSNATSIYNEERQPLGTLAGRGQIGSKHKGGRVVIKVDEPSYILGIVSITPNIDYSQGNQWDTNLATMDDFHKPALDGIGFQDLTTDQMAWWDTKNDASSGTLVTTFKSAGKQPAWINYMTNVNKVLGNFAEQSQQMFMVLNRRYSANYDNTFGWEISDVTTYIDPVKFNYIFADTRRDAQNFWTQIAVDITARRKMSAKIMPNL